MQGLTHKIQLVGDVPAGLDVLSQSSNGRLQTLVVRGELEQIQACLAAAELAFADVLPLSLEEIFIHELGGANYEIKNIVL